MTRLSYHGDPQFKAGLIAAAIEHRKADDYVSGTYRHEETPRFRGCSIGCSIYDVKKLRGVEIQSYDDHAALADALGFPEWLVWLQNQLYESLKGDEQRRWTEKFFGAIPDGVDLEPLGYELAARCLDRCVGYIGEGSEHWIEDCRRVVSESAAILRTGRRLNSAEVAQAAHAAEVAAWVARELWATRAAWAARAAEAVGSAEAVWAVWAAHAARAAGESWAKERKAQRDDLFELLAEANKAGGE